MTIQIIGDMIEAAKALLTAEEILLRVPRPDAKRARLLADEVSAAARTLVIDGIALPADAFDRFAALRHAIDLDGVESPLAAAAARAFADTSASEPREAA